jgi:hypothetical protein
MPKPKTPLHVYHIENADSYYYVAKSERVAFNLFLADQTYPKLTRAQYMKDCPETTITLCDPVKKFTITSLAEYTGEKEDESKTMTFAKWAKEAGEGVLAVSEI